MMLNIVVATRNRSANLRTLVESLLRLGPSSGFTWDVWIIDNNSNDETPELVKSLATREPTRVHYLLETKPGKSYALNRGIRESSGEVVAFTDDDCIPDSHWLENIAHEFATRSDLGIVGGRVELYDPRDLPITLRTSRERLVLSNGADVFSFIAGCNMAIRREVLDKVGGFDTKLGPGSPADAADDPDYIYRAFRMGTGVEYVPDILVFHNHGRRSPIDAKALTRSYLRGRGSFYAKHILGGDKVALKMAYWEFRPLFIGSFRALFGRKTGGEDWESLCSLLAGMGTRLTV
jgi:GT2 family glycosyltransferase